MASTSALERQLRELTTRVDAIALRQGGGIVSGSLPLGGATGQALRKSSNSDFAAEWFRPFGDGAVLLDDLPSGGDDSSLIQDALDELAPGGGTLYLRPGSTYRINNVEWEGTGDLNIVGLGRTKSYLRHVPVADGDIGLRLHGGGSQVTGVRLSNIGITTTNSTFNKTGLETEDTGQLVLENVGITGFGGANTDSVAWRTMGRQNTWASNLRLSANIPLHISANPNVADGYLSGDHFNVQNHYFTCLDLPDALTRAAVLIDPTVHISQMQFRSGAWRLAESPDGESNGLYWIITDTALTPYCSGLLLDSIRTESGANGNSSWSLRVECTTNRPLRNLTIHNCELDTRRNGYKTRHVDIINVISTILGHRTAGTPIPFDVDTMRAMRWDGVWTFADAKAGTLGADYTLLSEVPEAASYTYPHTAVWGDNT